MKSQEATSLPESDFQFHSICNCVKIHVVQIPLLNIKEMSLTKVLNLILDYVRNEKK